MVVLLKYLKRLKCMCLENNTYQFNFNGVIIGGWVKYNPNSTIFKNSFYCNWVQVVGDGVTFKKKS